MNFHLIYKKFNCFSLLKHMPTLPVLRDVCGVNLTLWGGSQHCLVDRRSNEHGSEGIGSLHSPLLPPLLDCSSVHLQARATEVAVAVHVANEKCPFLCQLREEALH